ncbi:MAG: sulfur-carrier protein adenylyltransferase/sulfurtransferase [Candidatus Eremiobacteraeota bacterium]|nr:sulfur-carrier protein adenylyltransferase/sulfurtransferase [Candidatus Eremiobacteraeota bacterium]
MNGAGSAGGGSELAGRRELRRYSRHLIIPQVGLAGQERLRAARVLCVGAGGLGSPVISYLAAAGVGRLGIVDDDVVDETNLQRQILFTTADIGRAKAEVAAERALAMNPYVAVDPIRVRLDHTNARELVRLYDVVVDGTDNFSSRYLINDACVLEGKPDVYGSIFRFDGQVSVFGAPGGPCYRCLFPERPPAGTVPTCAEGGVLGVLAGMVGTLQANEAIKLILGIGEPLIGILALVDALETRVRHVRIAKDPHCPVCGETPAITALRADDEDDELPRDPDELDPALLDALLAERPEVRVLDVRAPHEAVLGTLPNAVSIPAEALEARLHELDSATTYVVACRAGQVSLWAARRLRDAGFRRVHHLRGGFLRYAAYNEFLDVF